MPCLILHT